MSRFRDLGSSPIDCKCVCCKAEWTERACDIADVDEDGLHGYDVPEYCAECYQADCEDSKEDPEDPCLCKDDEDDD